MRGRLHKVGNTGYDCPSIIDRHTGTSIFAHCREVKLSSLCNIKDLLCVLRSFIGSSTIYYYCRCILKQTACIDVHGVPLIGDMLESLWLTQYKSSVSKVLQSLSLPLNLSLIRCRADWASSLLQSEYFKNSAVYLHKINLSTF